MEKTHTFVKGCPPGFCRPFLPSELQEMIEKSLPNTKAQENKNKKALLISGLPGSGKTSSLKSYIKDKHSLQDYVILDDEIIRSFHKQFIYELNGKGGISYRGLLPWFMEAVDYDKTIFQNETSLFNQVINQNRSFVLSGVLDQKGCFDLVKYIRIDKNYHVDFVFVHVSCDVAVQRARNRANKSGRWTSKKFIESREKNLYFLTSEISKFVIENGGVVTIFDNCVDEKEPRKIFDSNVDSEIQREEIMEKCQKKNEEFKID